MTGKRILYTVLLALGLVCIGTGVWFHLKASPPVAVPEGPPVIHMQMDWLMAGKADSLSIYNDGRIIYIREQGLRPPGAYSTRTWNTGTITSGQLDELLAYIENSGFQELGEYYQFEGEPREGGSVRIGDMKLTVSVDSNTMQKEVAAFGYLSPDGGQTYPDMPTPLNDIYRRLMDIAMTTGEVHRENIRD